MSLGLDACLGIGLGGAALGLGVSSGFFLFLSLL